MMFTRWIAMFTAGLALGACASVEGQGAGADGGTPPDAASPDGGGDVLAHSDAVSPVDVLAPADALAPADVTPAPADTSDAAAPEDDGGGGAAAGPEIVAFGVQTTPSVGLVAVLTVTTDVPTTLVGTLTDAETGEEVPIGPLPEATKHAPVLAGLRPGRTYAAMVTATAGGRGVSRGATFDTPELPRDLPTIVVHASTPERMAPGLTYIGLRNTIVGTRLTVALDATGALVRYWLGWDAATVLAGGDLLGISGDGALCQASTLGATVFCADPVPLGTPAFHHHPTRTAEGTYLVLGVELRTVDGFPEGSGSTSYNLAGDVVYELAAPGQLIRSYSLLDRLDPHLMGPVFDGAYWDLAFPGLPGGTHDWSHGNAVVQDATDDSWVVTLLGLSQVVKLDRQTGDVVWRFGPGGDFALAEGGSWCTLLHHAAPVDGGRLLLYCNQPLGGPWESAAVEYALETPSADPVTWKATETWRHVLQPPVTTRILGEAHRLENGNVLICDAAIDAEEPPDVVISPKALWGRIAEVSPEDGAEVFRIDVLPALAIPTGFLVAGVARGPDPFAPAP